MARTPPPPAATDGAGEATTLETPADDSFGAMLYARFGRSIAEKFLIPYNEKLYATDLDTLDVDAMGRFFPHADIADIIANMRPGAKDGGYNATFTYPAGGPSTRAGAASSRRLGARVTISTPCAPVSAYSRCGRST